MYSRLIITLALLLPCTVQAAPEINVGALYDYLDSGKSTLLKRVRNSGDATAFVKVSVAELVYDADGTPREIDQEGLPLVERTLVASPARLIVPAKGMQAVRLLYRGERGNERYFRVRFVPVLPEADDGFNLDPAQVEQYREGLKAGVNLLAGYGTLLFVRPAEVRYQTSVWRQQGQLFVNNEGNATVVMDNFRQCDGGGCEQPTKHHLLPGHKRQFSGHATKAHHFELQEGQSREQRVEGG